MISAAMWKSTFHGLPGLVSRSVRPSGILRKPIITTVTSGEIGRQISSATAVPGDDYPTRFVKEPAVLPRADPTVWGRHSKGGLLTPADLDHYDRHGFVVLPDVFTGKTLQDLTEDVMSRRDEMEKDLGATGPEDNIGDCRSGIYLSESNTRRLRTFSLTFRHVPLVNQLARYPPLLASIQQILDDDVYISQDRINFHAAFDGEGFYWHSDFESWHSEDGMPRPRAVNAMVLMSGNTQQNGALMVMPGSHWHFVSCPGQKLESNWGTILQKQYLGLPDRAILREFDEKFGIAYCTGEAGTVVLTDTNIIHGSHNNISPRGRCNLFLVYNAVSNKCGLPSGGTPARPEFLSTRDPQWMTPIKPLDIPGYNN